MYKKGMKGVEVCDNVFILQIVVTFKEMVLEHFLRYSESGNGGFFQILKYFCGIPEDSPNYGESSGMPQKCSGE